MGRKKAQAAACVTIAGMEGWASPHYARILELYKVDDRLRSQISALEEKRRKAQEKGGKKGTGRGEDQKYIDAMASLTRRAFKNMGKIRAETDLMEAEARGRIEKCADVIRDLAQRDNYHDNANTPSRNNTISRQQDRKIRAEERQPSERRPGGQPGHEGANKGGTITIDKTEEHTLDACTNCGSKNITAMYENTEIRRDVPVRPRAVTTKHIIPVYDCNDCSETEMHKHVGIPRDGMYGINTVIEVVENHVDRMPNRMNSDAVRRWGVGTSSGSIQNVLDRTRDYMAAPAGSILEHIRRCIILNIDETTVRFGNTTYWLWVFYDPLTGIAYYVIRPSRGGDVLREVLGADWDGVIVCDGLSPYRKYAIQRCWAHITREPRTVSRKNRDSREAAAALERLQKIFHDAKSVLDRPLDERKRHEKLFHRRVKYLVKQYADDPVIGGFMAKLGRAEPDLFKFVLDPRIPPTNNYAEHGFREVAIVRTIRGSLRSKKSLKRTADMLTCITTWKNQGLELADELKKIIPMI